jgi:prevent-host-death family protein
MPSPQAATFGCSADGYAVDYSKFSIDSTMSQADRTFSTSELSRRSGDIIAEALRHPVTITQRNKPRLVMMSIADYQRLRGAADPRRAGTLAEMPDALAAEIEAAIADYAAEGEPGP